MIINQKRRNWNREELILAFNLYCKIPYGTFHSHNPQIINLAELMNRTPGSVALKLSNFASFDPYHIKRGIKGMQNTGKLDREIWNEFTNNWDDLIFESEKLYQILKKDKSKNKEYISDFDFEKIGLDKVREVKTRINQNFFRIMILNSYSNCCSISGINIPDLLIASHIIPWSKNEKERLNPSNGICLSALHDRAFDKGLFGIRPDYSIALSKELKEKKNEKFFDDYFGKYENKKIILPNKFLPQPELLEFHYQEIFKK